MYFQFVVLTWNVIAIFICILQCSFWTSYIIWCFLILSHKPTTAPSSSSLHTILHSSSSTQNQIPNGTAWRPAGEGNSPPPDFLSTWGAVPSLSSPSPNHPPPQPTYSRFLAHIHWDGEANTLPHPAEACLPHNITQFGFTTWTDFVMQVTIVLNNSVSMVAI